MSLIQIEIAALYGQLFNKMIPNSENHFRLHMSSFIWIIKWRVIEHFN